MLFEPRYCLVYPDKSLNSRVPAPLIAKAPLRLQHLTIQAVCKPSEKALAPNRLEGTIGRGDLGLKISTCYVDMCLQRGASSQRCLQFKTCRLTVLPNIFFMVLCSDLLAQPFVHRLLHIMNVEAAQTWLLQPIDHPMPGFLPRAGKLPAG